MENLENNKLTKEIELINAQIKSLKYEQFKWVLGFIGALVLFILITRPESLLNRKSSSESISRERAKLLIEIIKEKDPLIRRRSLEVLMASYPPSEDQWLKKIENQIFIDSYVEKKNQLITEKLKIQNGIESGLIQGKYQIKIANQNILMFEEEIKNIDSELQKLE